MAMEAGFDYVRLAAGVLELGRLQEVLPPRAAFTASTAARAYGWMALSTIPPEMVVAVPDGATYDAVLAIRHPWTRLLPVIQHGYEYDIVEGEDAFGYGYRIVSRRQAMAALMHLAADAGDALREVLRRAARDVAQHEGATARIRGLLS
jgi:hypothetical protein